ncbi:MAG: hypothetical protein KAJ12_12660, partial [Bacteroidetes bacterium]|nr:hypothetical protein [Bacteroidota bacterium]
ALRATATVPLLFTPIEKEGMQLVDGGLVTNIPVDVARDAGCDIVIAVNTTSGLRNSDEMQTPWETADQIMGIMMQLSNEEQLAKADVVITPGIGRHLSSDFSGVESLVRLGEVTADGQVSHIRLLYDQKRAELLGRDEHNPARMLPDGDVSFSGEGIPDTLRHHILSEAIAGGISWNDVREYVDLMYALGDFQDVSAEIVWDSVSSHVTYLVVPNPVLSEVRIIDVEQIPEELLEGPFRPLLGRPLNNSTVEYALESVLRMYRKQGYSLARIDSVEFVEEYGRLSVAINEGVIDEIGVQGQVRTKDWYVLREFPLEEGDIFDIEKAGQGITNIN